MNAFLIFFRRVHSIAKSDCYFCHACSSAHPHEITKLPLDIYSLNLVFKYVPKIFEKIHIPLKYYKKTDIYFYNISPISSQSEKCFRQKL
jgi:hypothetical protein